MGLRSSLAAQVTSVLCGIGALAALAYALITPAPTPPLGTEVPRASIPSKSPQGIAPLPVRSGLRAQAGPLFGDSASAPAAAFVPEHQAAPPPSPPPMPYRFVGTLTRGGATEHLLAKDDIVFPVRQGETLLGAYKVEAVALQEVRLLYLPLGIATRLALTSAPATSLSEGPTSPPQQNAAPPPILAPTPAVATAEAGAASAPEHRIPNPFDTLTAASGTRAAHLRRERMQRLPPIP